jgi:hypothetical protein
LTQRLGRAALGLVQQLLQPVRLERRGHSLDSKARFPAKDAKECQRDSVSSPAPGKASFEKGVFIVQPCRHGASKCALRVGDVLLT